MTQIKNNPPQACIILQINENISIINYHPRIIIKRTEAIIQRVLNAQTIDKNKYAASFK